MRIRVSGTQVDLDDGLSIHRDRMTGVHACTDWEGGKLKHAPYKAVTCLAIGIAALMLLGFDAVYRPQERLQFWRYGLIVAWVVSGIIWVRRAFRKRRRLGWVAVATSDGHVIMRLSGRKFAEQVVTRLQAMAAPTSGDWVIEVDPESSTMSAQQMPLVQPASTSRHTSPQV